MRNETGKTKPSRSGRNTPGGTSPQHTAEQRVQMQTGLRILAWIIARAHLRREADRPGLPPPPDRRGSE